MIKTGVSLQPVTAELKTLVQLCKPDVQEIKAASESEIPPTVALKKQLQEDGLSLGTYIVGGSAFDWNFITYLGNKAAYYGLTKEEFRAKKSLPSLASYGVGNADRKFPCLYESGRHLHGKLLT